MSKIREFLFTLLKDERGMMVGLVSVVAVAGWGLALASMGGSGGLEEKLLAAEADLTVTKAEVSKMSAEIAAAREVQQGIQEATASLADMARQLESDRGELAVLTLKIDAAKARLDTLRAEAKERQDLVADAAPSYRTTTRARVRAAPTTESKEVAMVPAGTPLVVLGSVEDGVWYRVGHVGFMHRDLLTPASSAPRQ
ncbi:MAG: SH3 domain-containing protein [Proteobacteria bacterium]|nr:SH3 domain-containing protein [Pseudomonadota bacterium]